MLACSTDLNLAASSSSSPLIDAVLCLLPGPAVVLVLGPQGILEHSVEVWYVGRRYACFHLYFPRSRTGMSGNYIQAVQARCEGLIDFIRRQIPARRSSRYCFTADRRLRCALSTSNCYRRRRSRVKKGGSGSAGCVADRSLSLAVSGDKSGTNSFPSPSPARCPFRLKSMIVDTTDTTVHDSHCQ